MAITASLETTRCRDEESAVMGIELPSYETYLLGFPPCASFQSSLFALHRYSSSPRDGAHLMDGSGGAWSTEEMDGPNEDPNEQPPNGKRENQIRKRGLTKLARMAEQKGRRVGVVTDTSTSNSVMLTSDSGDGVVTMNDATGTTSMTDGMTADVTNVTDVPCTHVTDMSPTTADITSYTTNVTTSSSDVTEDDTVLPAVTVRLKPADSDLVSTANGPFPNLMDGLLARIGLHKRRNDNRSCEEKFSEQDIEDKYSILALAFKTDKLTLDRRIELHKRARDVAEQNAGQELQGVRVAMKALRPLCMDCQSRSTYSSLEQHVDVLDQTALRMSSRAEVYGAVQQELRLSNAVDVILQYVDNLKRSYEKEHNELEDTRRLLEANKLTRSSVSAEPGVDPTRPKRSLSVATGLGVKTCYRRASVATIPRLVQEIRSSNDFRSKVRLALADRGALDTTSAAAQDNKNNGCREDVSAERTPSSTGTLSTEDCDSAKVFDTSADQTTADNVFQQSFIDESNKNTECSESVDSQNEVACDKGDLANEKDVTEKKTVWRDIVSAMRGRATWQSDSIRYGCAGMLLLLAFITLFLSLLPAGTANEHRQLWSSLDELLRPYATLHHRRAPPL